MYLDCRATSKSTGITSPSQLWSLIVCIFLLSLVFLPVKKIGRLKLFLVFKTKILPGQRNVASRWQNNGNYSYLPWKLEKRNMDKIFCTFEYTSAKEMAECSQQRRQTHLLLSQGHCTVASMLPDLKFSTLPKNLLKRQNFFQGGSEPTEADYWVEKTEKLRGFSSWLLTCHNLKVENKNQKKKKFVKFSIFEILWKFFVWFREFKILSDP